MWARNLGRRHSRKTAICYAASRMRLAWREHESIVHSRSIRIRIRIRSNIQVLTVSIAHTNSNGYLYKYKLPNKFRYGHFYAFAEFSIRSSTWHGPRCVPHIGQVCYTCPSVRVLCSCVSAAAIRCAVWSYALMPLFISNKLRTGRMFDWCIRYFVQAPLIWGLCINPPIWNGWH